MGGVEQVQHVDLAVAQRLEGGDARADRLQLHLVPRHAGILQDGPRHEDIAGGEREDADRLAAQIGDLLDRALLGNDELPDRAREQVVDEAQREVRLARLARDHQRLEAGIGGIDLAGQKLWHDHRSARQDLDLHVELLGLEVAELAREAERRHAGIDRRRPDEDEAVLGERSARAGTESDDDRHALPEKNGTKPNTHSTDPLFGLMDRLSFRRLFFRPPKSPPEGVDRERRKQAITAPGLCSRASSCRRSRVPPRRHAAAGWDRRS